MTGSQETNPTKLRFQESDFSIVVAEPRLLIVKLQSSGFKCLIVAAHAPHTGAELSIIEDFWKHVADSVPSGLAAWPRLILADANCRLGSQPCDRIGDWNAEVMTEKSVPFAHFVTVSDVFLPSTFEQFHEGDSGTWLHPSGLWKRNDYIGLPCSWTIESCRSWIPEEVDFSLQKEDHRMVCLQVQWTENSGLDKKHRRLTKPKVFEFDTTRVAQCAWSSQPDFTLDVHTDAISLQTKLLSCRKRGVTATKKPCKGTLSAASWELICTKKQWRNALHEHTRLRRLTLQAMVFAAWRFSKWHQDAIPHVQGFDALLSEHDHAIAKALYYFRKLGSEVTRAVRADDCNFYRKLAGEAAEFLGPYQVKEFWKILRRHLPKFRLRRLGQDPNRIEALHDQWVPYFQQLEIGAIREAEDIVQQCHDRQQKMPVVQTAFQVDDLPSLIELEDSIRLTQPDRGDWL